jgi:cytidylate kinase
MVNQRIKEWEIGNSIYENKDRRGDSPDHAPGLVITISREHGCHGAAVAKMLSDEMGLELFDTEIVEMIARDKKIAARVVATLDEKGRSELEVFLDGAIGNRGISSLSFFRSLKRVLFTIALHGNAVIVGRGAGLLLPPEKRISIRLVAPLETRVQNVMAENDCDEKSALALITKVEQERSQFVSKYLNKNIGDPSLYDAVINLAAMDPQAVPGMVKAMQAHHATKPDKSMAMA